MTHYFLVSDNEWFYSAEEKIGEGKEEKEKDSYAWLEEIEMPENSEMDGIEYLGPTPF